MTNPPLMPPARAIPKGVTTEDLMTRGLFHDRIVPPLNASGLSSVMDELIEFAETDRTFKSNVWRTKQSTECVRHSYPKRRLSRRILSVPHPRNQIFVAMEVEKHWQELKLFCDRSRISLTSPALSTNRALEGVHQRKNESIERSKRSVGLSFVVHADLSRFYPSIYTHSIPWAIHGKMLRSDRRPELYGNLLDLWIRETQSKQTGGIPVGPDTSYLIAEVIASAIDRALEDSIGEYKGTRYIDDYHLYFPTRAEAERALAELHRIAATYELDINDSKTSIEELPEAIEPHWKTQLRAVHIAKKDHATSIKAIFDLGALLAKQHPQDGVFAYLAKKIEAVVSSLKLSDNEWELVDALLLRSILGDPSCLSTVLRIFEKNDRYPNDANDALNRICIVHAPLGHGSEVAWALWAARSRRIRLSQACANAIETMDDDIVALVALDLHFDGLLPRPTNNFSFWKSLMVAGSLYSEHWLLAYEALVQRWLPPANGKDYIKADAYFSILQQKQIRFFDTSEDIEVPEDEGYEEDDDYEEDEEGGDEDDDDDNEEDDEADI